MMLLSSVRREEQGYVLDALGTFIAHSKGITEHQYRMTKLPKVAILQSKMKDFMARQVQMNLGGSKHAVYHSGLPSLPFSCSFGPVYHKTTQPTNE